MIAPRPGKLGRMKLVGSTLPVVRSIMFGVGLATQPRIGVVELIRVGLAGVDRERIAHGIPHVGHIGQQAPWQLALHADAPGMDGDGPRLRPGPRSRQGVLERRRVEAIVDRGPLQVHGPADHTGEPAVLAVAQAVVARAESAADHGLAVTQDVPAEPETWRGPDASTGDRYRGAHGRRRSRC